MLRVQTLHDQLLGFTEELGSQHGHRGGAVADLGILRLGDLDQNAGRRVVNVHGAEDSGTIIGHGDILALRTRDNRLEDLIHALGTQGGLDEVTHGNSTDKVGNLGYFAFHLLSLVF